MLHSIHNLSRPATNHRHLFAIAITCIVLIGSYLYYTHMYSMTSPSLKYPLSQHNVEVFSQIPNYSTLLQTYEHNSRNQQDKLYSSIYGPFVPQPDKHNEPFNATSLVFVATMFIVSIMLCS